MTEIATLSKKRLIGIVACNSIEYITTAFEALSTGRIVVPLRTLDDSQRINSTKLTEIISPEKTTGWFTPVLHTRSSDDAAQISFTSGTQGNPKGVILSHNALNDTVARLHLSSAFNSSAREYIGIPVFHSFGYGRCRLIAEVGGKAYIPQDGFNPSEIARMLKHNEINSLSAVPSLLRVLLKNRSLFGEESKKLLWIEIGSQSMKGDEKLLLRELFPNACIIQHYGLTEASRACLLRIDTANPEQLDSVGKAVGNTKIKVNQQGKICIQGSLLASGLLIDGKVEKLTDADGWFETSDLGHIKDTFLYYDGRADNSINCGGQKISAEVIESELLNALSLTNGVAIARIPDDVYGEGVLLVKDSTCNIQKDELCNTANTIIQHYGVNASNVLRYLIIDQIPITETGKTQRNLLSKLYIEKQSQKPHDIKESNNKSPLQRILALYSKEVGPIRKVQEEDSIESLGMDSISVVTISISLEKIIGHIPPNFRSLSISTLSTIKFVEDVTTSTEDRGSIKPTKGSTNENPQGIQFWSLVKEDYKTHESDFFSQGFWAIFNHRFGNWRMGVKTRFIRAPLTLLYRIHLKLIQILCGIKLDYTVKLGRRVKIEHFGGIIIGAKSIGDDVTIRQNTTFGIKSLSNLDGKPNIESNVNIGTGAVIVGDITVGRYSVIGPNTVIDRNIPPFSTINTPEAIITTAGASDKS